MSRSTLNLKIHMYAKRRLRSACASTQSDQNLRCQREEVGGTLATNRTPGEDSA